MYKKIKLKVYTRLIFIENENTAVLTENKKDICSYKKIFFGVFYNLK